MRGIKTKIGLNVIALLLLSAVVTDIVVIVVVQRIMVRNEISRSSQYIENLGRLFFSDHLDSLSKHDPRQELATTLILSQDRIRNIHIVDDAHKTLYRQRGNVDSVEMINQLIKTARSKRKIIISETDYIWSLFWWQPGTIFIAIPINDSDHLKGIIGAALPLTPIYQQLRKYHKPILFYILMNTGVLTIVGLYRIFRLYLRPIDRIVSQADEFHEDGDLFFAFRHEDNELNRLSSALNRMFSRISSDKKKLQDTVISLEQTNIELKKAQKEIIRAEKMASVGRLAAGIAHEIGNPIGIVLGYLDMLIQSDLSSEDRTDFLKRTEDEVQRINRIIRQLLDLARPKTSNDDEVAVSAVIQDIVSVMKLQPVMSNTRIAMDFAAVTDSVWGKADQLRQVFLNLLINAADAIKISKSWQTGRIQIRTFNPAPTKGVERSFLNISFSDNGDGIDPAKIQSIFDPFYTTKEPGEGTGLGLAVSYMIVEGMGGTIQAENRVDQGATFTLSLPLSSSNLNTTDKGVGRRIAPETGEG